MKLLPGGISSLLNLPFHPQYPLFKSETLDTRITVEEQNKHWKSGAQKKFRIGTGWCQDGVNLSSRVCHIGIVSAVTPFTNRAVSCFFLQLIFPRVFFLSVAQRIISVMSGLVSINHLKDEVDDGQAILWTWADKSSRREPESSEEREKGRKHGRVGKRRQDFISTSPSWRGEKQRIIRWISLMNYIN